MILCLMRNVSVVFVANISGIKPVLPLFAICIINHFITSNTCVIANTVSTVRLPMNFQ